MSRIASLFAVALVLAVGLASPLAVAAKQATPAALGPAGEAVSIVGTDGAEVGRVTLTELADPFDAYDAFYPPEHGFHYVLATVSVENTGARPLPVDPNAFRLLDADGYLNHPGSVFRGEDVTVPDLQYQEIAPGDTISGAVAFQTLNGVALSALLFLPSNEQVVTIATLGETSIAGVGEAASILGPDGAEIAQVTVQTITDPFPDYDPSSPPERGNRFVTLSLSVTNTGPRPLAVDPNAVSLLGNDGFLYSPGFVNRGAQPAEADFTYQDGLAPGATAAGAIGFQVLNGVLVVSVLYRPDSDRFITLAEVTTG
ncbi:MAG: DUF4352 domain-containing protein [Thermomicrobiales bacterium]